MLNTKAVQVSFRHLINSLSGVLHLVSPGAPKYLRNTTFCVGDVILFL